MTTLDHEQPVDLAAVQAARAAVIDVADAGHLAGLLGLIQDPVRARLLFALSATDELCVGDLALVLDVSVDTVSYALKLLRTASLVQFRKEGRTVYYRLAEGLPHQLLEHCLRELVRIAKNGATQASDSPTVGNRIADRS